MPRLTQPARAVKAPQLAVVSSDGEPISVVPQPFPTKAQRQRARLDRLNRRFVIISGNSPIVRTLKGSAQ